MIKSSNENDATVLIPKKVNNVGPIQKLVISTAPSPIHPKATLHHLPSSFLPPRRWREKF